MFKKIILSLTISALLFSSQGHALASPKSTSTVVDFDDVFALENMETVVLEETEDETLTAIVPKDKVEQYLDSLQRNPDFKREQIEAARGNLSAPFPSNTYRNGSTAPIHTRDFTRAEVERAVRRSHKVSEFFAYLNSPSVQGSALATLLRGTGYTALGPWIGVITLGSVTLGHMASRNNRWWKTSLDMLMKRQIKAIRMSIQQNTQSPYPVAFVRIYRVYW